RYEASRSHCNAILASARARKNLQHEAWALCVEGRSLIPLGRFEEAQRCLAQALELLRRQSDRASEIICTGLLSLTDLRLGEICVAELLADATMNLIGRSPPTMFNVGDGYSGAAEVYLELWKRERMSPALARKAARAWGALGTFALMFRFGRPS